MFYKLARWLWVLAGEFFGGPPWELNVIHIGTLALGLFEQAGERNCVEGLILGFGRAAPRREKGARNGRCPGGAAGGRRRGAFDDGDDFSERNFGRLANELVSA